MNTQRVREEIDAFQDAGYTVAYDPHHGIIDLPDLEYPADWRPGTSVLRFDLADIHPETAPTVHVPATVRFQGHEVVRMKQSQYPGWRKWCVRFGWNPRRHTLVTVLRQMMISLSDPARSRVVPR